MNSFKPNQGRTRGQAASGEKRAAIGANVDNMNEKEESAAPKRLRAVRAQAVALLAPPRLNADVAPQTPAVGAGSGAAGNFTLFAYENNILKESFLFLWPRRRTAKTGQMQQNTKTRQRPEATGRQLCHCGSGLSRCLFAKRAHRTPVQEMPCFGFDKSDM